MGGFSSITSSQGSGGVPASVPASASATSSNDEADIGELIKNISTPIDPELIRAATSPVAGSHAAQVPSSLQRPIQPYQNAPLANTNVVGRSYGRAVGIGNAITSTLNVLGSVTKMEAQHKQDQIRDAATKVITAQQAIDEAQQAHDAATASGDKDAAARYQQIIDQNTKARDGIFADPKMRKALVKGFDISYTDPQSNKTEEHAAVQAAIKNAKTLQEKKQAVAAMRQKQNETAGQTAGAAFAKSQPQGLAPNTQAQQKLQLELQNRTVMQQVAKDYLTYKASMARANAPVLAAQVRGLYSLQQQNIKNQQDQLKIQEQFDDRMKLLDAQTASRLRLQWNSLAVADAKEMDRLKISARDPLSVTKMADESDRLWQSNIESIQGRLTAATNQLTTLQMAKATPQQIQQLQNEVDATKLALQQAQNKQAYWSGVMATYKKMAGLPDEPQEGGQDGNGTSSGSSANSIKSYTGNDPTKIINEINSGTLDYSLPAVP